MPPILKDKRHARLAEEISKGKGITEAAELAEIAIPLCEKPSTFYVYLLVNPLSDAVFYVGKGKDYRFANHEAACRSGHFEDNIAKHLVIEAILAAGLRPLAYCLQDALSEPDAFGLERAMIAGIGLKNLTNQSRGQTDMVAAHKEMAMYTLSNRLIWPKEWARRNNPTKIQLYMYCKVVLSLLKIAIHGPQSNRLSPWLGGSKLDQVK